MNAVLARTAPEPEPATKRRLRNRRDDSGLTTLEWLLIVAAVAGLAALAVVLVTNVVSGTSEQIEGQSARKQAATLAGVRITEDAAAHDFGSATLDAQVFLAAANEYRDDCNRLKVVYPDVDNLNVSWTYTDPGTYTEATWAAAFDDPETEGCLVS